MRVLVTGASGFIGSAFIRRVLDTMKSPHQLIALARNTNQRNLGRLRGYTDRIHLVYGDLLGDISGLCEGVDAVVHFAAKTFVDASIRSPEAFVASNIAGTARLLEDARRNGVKRWIQVGTDEVYGAILTGAYDETARLNPTNPYSASKAGGDALAIAYAHTYGLHTVVTRMENCYGPFQHRQKVFPTFIRKALAGEPLPVYGDGLHSRQWLWVDDAVDAMLLLLEADIPAGEVYHIAGNQELTNLELARRLLRVFDEVRPDPEGWHKPFADRIAFIDDRDLRPGHDRRYALQSDKLQALGWSPQVGLDSGIEHAVRWYTENEWWLT